MKIYALLCDSGELASGCGEKRQPRGDEHRFIGEAGWFQRDHNASVAERALGGNGLAIFVFESPPIGPQYEVGAM